MTSKLYTMDLELRWPVTRLLAAAYDLWAACPMTGETGAVWIEGKAGELVIFARGAYKQQLLAVIDSDNCETHVFGSGTRVNDEEEDQNNGV